MRTVVTLLAGALIAASCGRAAPTPGVTPPPSSTPPSTPAASAVTPAAPAGTWAALGQFTPTLIQPNQARLAADPAHPNVLATCATGAVRVSRDGGATWAEVPTSGVAKALSATAYALMVAPGSGAPTPACDSAAADPQRADGVYAVYSVGMAKYGAPPVFHVAVVTTDSGKTWKAVPPPTGFEPGGFGGLTAGTTVQALFGRALGADQTAQPPFAVTETADGGATWKAAALSCPASGPCLRWGPAPSGTGSCAMHDYPQPIERSADGGHTWSPAYDPAKGDLANGCDFNELVALGDRALLVGRDVNAQVSVLLSTDSGSTWTPVTLPALPDGTSPAPGGVQMLPDGALLAAGSPNVALLAPGATNWCTVPGVTLQGTYTNPATLQPAGDRLIWLEQASAAATPTLHSVPLSAVHC